MKNRTYCLGFALAALSLLLSSCATQEGEPSSTEETTTRTDWSVRSVTTDESSYAFPEDARIRIHASGGLSVDKGALVYTGGHWLTEDVYRWKSGEDLAHVVALYPWMEKYDSASLYDADGCLTDLLYADVSLPAGQPISLQMGHRFGRLVFVLDAALAPQLEKLVLSVDKAVAEVDAASSVISLDDSRAVAASRTVGDAGEVEFIVPAECEVKPVVTLAFRDGSSEAYALDPLSLDAGEGWTFRLVVEETRNLKRSVRLVLI